MHTFVVCLLPVLLSIMSKSVPNILLSRVLFPLLCPPMMPTTRNLPPASPSPLRSIYSASSSLQKAPRSRQMDFKEAT